MAKKNLTSSIPPSANTETAQAALEDLDRVFHERARLGILTIMVSSNAGLSFNELKDLSDLTDGNLNRHLKVLVDAGVIGVKKTGQGRNMNSLYRLTANGRRAFDHYLSALEIVLLAAKSQALRVAKPIAEKKQLGNVSPES